MHNKRILYSSLILISLILLVYLAYKYLMPATLKPGEYKTAIVDYGPVAMSVPASGVVNPGSEVLLLSPSSSIISKIRVAPGSQVSKGDLLLSLDPRLINQEIENLQDQLGIMENDLQKNWLNARSTRVDMDYSTDVKKLKITSLKAEIADKEQLLKVGGISPAMLEQTKQELVLAEKDLKTTQEKNAIRLKQLETEEQGLQLQVDVRKKELESKLTQLSMMNIKAPSDGIILTINGNEGEKVDKDKLLIRMSDLSTYKLKCSIDNKLVSTLKTGGDAFAIVDNARLKGRIGNISPVITDKKIQFDVFLDKSNVTKLIPNLEVGVMIITHQKDSVLRVEKGDAFNKSKQQDAYVVSNEKAVKKRITTGLIGTDYVEITSGLNPGDRVIISDINAFRHKKEVDCRDQ